MLVSIDKTLNKTKMFFSGMPIALWWWFISKRDRQSVGHGPIMHILNGQEKRPLVK